MAKENNGEKRVDRALRSFVDQLVARMEDAAADMTWKKPWIVGKSHYIGLPQNIKGYVYTGGQALLLQLHTMEKGYSMPIYMTAKQASELGAHINKGAKSTDVFKWGLRVFEKETHKRISEDMYRRMTKEEQENYDVHPYLRSFIEFNIDQTNFKEVHPDRYEALLRKFSVEEGKVVRDTTGMYDNEALNRLIHEDGQWICPIIEEKGAQAAYSPGANRIEIPLKSDFNMHPGDAEETFKDGEAYYSTALHEMAHSTGHASYLGRPGVVNVDHFGSSQYAKEELVAELTAATVSNALGFDKRITENSAAYLKGWAASLKQDPRYIVSVMSEVNKAALIELEHIDEQRKALGEKPLLEGNLDGVEEKKHNQQDMEAAVSAALDRGKKEAQLLGLFGLPVQDTYYNKVDLTKEGDDGEVRDLYDRTALYNLYANGENDKVVQRLGEARQKFNLTLDNTLPGSFKYELPDYENIGEDGKYVYMVSSDADEGFVMMEKVSKDDLLHKHLPQHLDPDHLSAIGYEGKKIEDIMALAGELGLALGKPEKNASDTETLTETVEDEKDMKDNSSKEVYYAGASVIEKRYAGSFQAYLENGDTASMLGEARSWMQQNNTTVEQYMIMDSSEVATQDIIAEDDTLAIVDAKLSYDIFPKLTKEEIIADIRKNGVDSDATHVVRDIAYEDVARQFAEKKRDPILEMPSGDLLTLRYNKETNTLDVGPGTDASIVVRNAFPYHNGQTLDENLGIVKEELRELPYYQNTEELSEDKEKRRAVFKEVFSQPSHTMTMPDSQKLDYAYEMEFNTVSFAITAEGVTHVIQSYDYDLGKDLEANLADFKRDLSSRPEFKEQVTSTVDVANASEENVSQIKNNNNMDEKKVTENPEKEVYYVAADTVASEYAEDFEAYRKNGNKAVMLNTARDWMRQYDISVEQHMVMQPSEVVRERIIAEDDNMAVAYNEKSDSYDIMPKLSKEQVLDDIRKNGLDSDASQVVKSIAYEDVARQFGEMEKSPVLEMPSGDILYLQYNKETNKMEVGSGTNVGVAVSHEFDYDLDQSLDENLQIVNEELSKMPEYQEEEEVTATAEQTATQTQTAPRDEKKFYTSFAFMQMQEDTEQFEKLRQEGKYDEMLFLASEHVQDSDIELEYIKENARSYQGDDLVAENEELAIVYNGAVGGTYDLMMKVSENEIREKIEREGGLECYHKPDYPKAVWDIQRNMVEEEWKNAPDGSTIKTDSGKTFSLAYDREHDKILVSDPEDAEKGILKSFPYNYVHSVRENFRHVYEDMRKLYPQEESKRTVIDDTEKAGILKDIIKFAGDDVAHPLHGVSNMKEFQEAFASSSTEDLYSNYVEDNSVLDYDNESLEEVKGYVASATQGQLVAAGASNLFNYHYPHHEGRTCNSMLHAIMRIENMAAANPDDKQVQKRLSQAYDIYNIYRKRAVEGMSEQQALKFASPLNNNMVPRSHYSDGIRPMALREQFANEHSESLRLYLPNGEEKKALYNKEKDAYDIGHGKGSEFILEQSYPVKDFYMDESIELYRHLTGIVYDNNPNVAVEWDEKVIDNSIVFTDGEKGKVNYDIADDTIEVKSSVSDYEDYDVRIPYDHRISVEENLRRVADVLKYDGYDIKSYPVELSPSKEVISKGVGEQDKPILGMKDYVSSLKDPNDALSGDYSKLPKDSQAYSAWQENEKLVKEYVNFMRDPSKYDLQSRSELFAKMGAVGPALNTAVKAEVERYKRLAPAYEDSNIQTNVVADAKKIADSGIPMEKAEKIAKAMASDMAHEDMHHKEQEDHEKDDKEQKQREQAKKEEQKKQEAEKKKEEQKKETPHMALSHSALLLAALAAAKENEGVWMNGGYRSNASFLDSKKSITTYNNIMMNLAAEQQGFKTNVYTNFDLAKQNGMPVLESQKSLPFSWTNWKYVNKSNEADVLSSKQYHALPKAEQANYVSHAQRVSLPVFNIDQTTLPASDYAAYKEILKKESDRSETLKMDKETNLFRTYSEVSKKHPDSVVLMRDGDSYKSYNASARKVAKALGLPMGKGEYQGKEVDFIEFNFTRLDDYLPRIIRDKNRVAICDRLQDPKYIKDVADSGKILSDAYGLAKSVAKTDGMKYERVMVVQDAKYDRASNTFSVSGMSAEGKDTRTAAIEKATDIYRKLVMVTGLSDRLDRGGRNHLTPIDDVKYDKLVQELGAGVLMARQGLPATLSKEGQELIPYWQMEIKENPRMMGIIERDVNTAVEVIDNLSQGVKPNYMKILGTMPEKVAQNKSDYSVIKNINKLPDIDSKRFVIIKDEKSASVILPKGASLKVDNEVSGMRKERILTVLRKEGVESENVKFYNAGGSLGLKQKNDFFAGKTVSLVRLNQWQFEKLQDVKVSSFLPKKEAKTLAFTVLKNDDGKYFFHIKPSGEKGFCVDPEKKFVNSYFSTVRTGDPKGIAAMKKALSQQFYKLASEHDDMKKDFITPRKIDVDYNRIQRVYVASSKKDPNVKLVSAMIDGERQVATITDSQWKKMWLAEDMNAYKLGVAAVAFENILTQGKSQEANLDLNQEQSESVGQEVKNEEQDDVDVGRGKKIISPTPEPESTRGVRM